MAIKLDLRSQLSDFCPRHLAIKAESDINHDGILAGHASSIAGWKIIQMVGNFVKFEIDLELKVFNKGTKSFLGVPS